MARNVTGNYSAGQWPALACALAAVLLASCSGVTTYGKAPKQTGPGRYEFTLYYNADATDASIDRKAAQVVDTIRAGNGHDTCGFSRQAMVDPWRVKEVDVVVICQ